MRAKNIELTIKMNLPVDEPDKNGFTYPKDVLQNAFKDVDTLPLCVTTPSGETIVIGTINSAVYFPAVHGHYVLMNAVVWNGGTKDVAEHDNNNIVQKMNIECVGMTSG